MGVNNVGGPGTVQMMSLEGLDLESMLMAVQTNRVNLLDQQIKDQMVAVQDRNNRINALNVNMNGMNAALAKVGSSATESLAGFTAEFQAAAPQVVDTAAMQERASVSGTSTFDFIAYGDYSPGSGQIRTLLPACLENNIPVPDALKNFPLPENYEENTTLPPAEANLVRNLSAALSSKIKAGQAVLTKADPAAIACANRSQAEAYIKTQQSQIDALGNSQQQDMLRLQSLSNKRNEAFEIMTNFMKKLSDARASIIQKF